ncbi:DUF948 domain-containing protein [Aciduricibacillus chroicocephali]|uniref:DUF948 domain-containing protein n=1 Tax=Aciduricibacillus chroicocephali TaxID=3054939 RepID=A0ABY9KX98_9BACI|nr:DUF948 domain-containing protein [Bacillaceae bacterium 44XB]
MSLTGLGVLIIGIAFAIFAVSLGRTMLKTAALLKSSDVIVEKTPKQIYGIMDESSYSMRYGNDALADLNTKMHALTPLFYAIGDLGKSSESGALWVQRQAEKLNRESDKLDGETESKIGNNAYGSIALAMFLMKKRKELQRVKKGLR